MSLALLLRFVISKWCEIAKAGCVTNQQKMLKQYPTEIVGSIDCELCTAVSMRFGDFVPNPARDLAHTANGPSGRPSLEALHGTGLRHKLKLPGIASFGGNLVRHMRIGIALRLGVGFVGVGVLALAANFALEQGVLIEQTTQITRTAPPKALPKSIQAVTAPSANVALTSDPELATPGLGNT